MKERTVGIALGIAASAIALVTAGVLSNVTSALKKKPVSAIPESDVACINHVINYSDYNSYPCEYYMLRTKRTEQFFDKDDKKTFYTKCAFIKVEAANCDQTYIVIQPGKTKRGGGLFPIQDGTNLKIYDIYFGATHEELATLYRLTRH